MTPRVAIAVVLVLLAAPLLGVSACPASSPDGPAEGEGEGEGEGDDCARGLPPPSDPCLPVCGNEQFVGQPCTKGGGECNEHIGHGAGFCTADFSDTTLAYCTRPCSEDANCGTGAVCTGDPEDPGSGKGCIPAACVGEGEGEGEGE